MRFTRSWTFVIMIAAALVGGVLPARLPAQQTPEIFMSSYGGTLDEVFRVALADPFERATGSKVTLVPSLSTETIAKIKASRANPPFDIVPLDEGPHLQAVADGIVQTLTPQQVSNMTDLHQQYLKVTRGHGVPQAYSVAGIIYNPQKVKNPPRSWRDLWKPEYKGQLGIVNLNSSLGVAFLVMAARLHGGGEKDIEAGFRALKDLMPNVAVIAPRPGALAALLERQEVSIAVLWNNWGLSLREKGMAVEWVEPTDGAIIVLSIMNMVTNTKHSALVARFINDSISRDFQIKASLPPYYFGPTNSKVRLPQAMARLLPSTPEQVERLVFLDWNTINPNRSAWTDRFNREFGR